MQIILKSIQIRPNSNDPKVKSIPYTVISSHFFISHIKSPCFKQIFEESPNTTTTFFKDRSGQAIAVKKKLGDEKL